MAPSSTDAVSISSAAGCPSHGIAARRRARSPCSGRYARSRWRRAGGRGIHNLVAAAAIDARRSARSSRRAAGGSGRRSRSPSEPRGEDQASAGVGRLRHDGGVKMRRRARPERGRARRGFRSALDLGAGLLEAARCKGGDRGRGAHEDGARARVHGTRLEFDINQPPRLRRPRCWSGCGGPRGAGRGG